MLYDTTLKTLVATLQNILFFLFFPDCLTEHVLRARTLLDLGARGCSIHIRKIHYPL